MRKKLLLIAYFLCMVAETPDMYLRQWTPMKLFGWFIDHLTLKASPFELVCWALVLTARGNIRRKSAPELIRTIQVSLGAVVFWIVLGLVRGGWGKAMYTQIHMWVAALMFTLAILATLTTVDDYRRLGRVIVFAALYRSVMVLYFYSQVQGTGENMPPVMTTHDDTVLFVTALLILISNAIEARTKHAVRSLILALPLVILAIQFNNRRLAWASLIEGLIVIYAMLPKRSAALRRVNRYLLVLAPIVLAYVVVGWGRTEKIFKPLASLSSMGVGEKDPSTLARDNENWGMMLQILQKPLFGTGLGHEWFEVDSTYTVNVKVFPMYHYAPHDNILSTLAFTGGLGYIALFLVFGVATFLLARTYRGARLPLERTIAAVGIADIVVVFNQMFGDMGFISLVPMTMGACALAAAGRVSVLTGAWGQRMSTS